MILPLRLEQVSFLHVLQPLSLAIEAGPSTIILGRQRRGQERADAPDARAARASSGKVSWSGADARRRQAMVFQRPVMLRRSAFQNVLYALDVAGVTGAERLASEALAEVG
jgi:tungstate transport system ATP-binding protein